MSRLDKLKKQHPGLNVPLIEIIASIDPTNTYKYLEFLVKQFKNNELYSSESDTLKEHIAAYLFGPEQVVTLNEFERHAKDKRIKNNDISSYEDFYSLNEEVKRANEIELEKKSEKEIKKLYWSNEWIVLTPLTWAASKRYGSGTTWCTTTPKHWDKYLKTHRLIYVENKKTGFKIAFSREINSTKTFSAWTAEDIEVSPIYYDLPDEIFLIITKELRKNESTFDLAKKENVWNPEIRIDWGDINIHTNSNNYPTWVRANTNNSIVYDNYVTSISDIDIRELIDRYISTQLGSNITDELP